MRNILFLSIVLFLVSACTSKEKLDREKALSILKEKKSFPKILEEEIYTADPEDAKKILDLGLEEEGLLIIQRTQSLADIGKPLIIFKDKAKSYLISQTDEDKIGNVQRVKIAEEDLDEVTGVQILEGNKQAIVEYKTSFKNITPFSKLSKLKLDGNNTHKIKFSLYDDGWRVESE